ncbi:3394_t:CDS:2 [Funneliformis geosporum]|nr:3394_t:CDS:2 [Funneliformis geosporum]
MNRFWNSRLSFFASREIQILLNSRSYATSTESSSHRFPKEGFGAPIWRRTIGVFILGFAWYQADRYFVKDGEKHPVTKWIENLMIPESEYKRRNLEHLYLSAEASKDKQFEKASSHCIEPGTEIDLSDLVVRQD